jgi:CheY-like chemotaxis protein
MDLDHQKIHALIADREKHLRDIIRGLLHELGLPLENIRQCGSGEDALELLKIRKSDFLVAGRQMEPMDGLTLIRTLRDPDLTPAPGIPIIFCSDSVDMRLLDTAYAAGVNEILVKPFNAQAIRSRVTAVLERPRPIVHSPTYVGPQKGRPRGETDDDSYWTIC